MFKSYLYIKNEGGGPWGHINKPLLPLPSLAKIHLICCARGSDGGCAEVFRVQVLHHLRHALELLPTQHHHPLATTPPLFHGHVPPALCRCLPLVVLLLLHSWWPCHSAPPPVKLFRCCLSIMTPLTLPLVGLSHINCAIISGFRLIVWAG